MTDDCFVGQPLPRTTARQPAPVTPANLLASQKNLGQPMSNETLQCEKALLDEQVSTALRENPHLRNLRIETSEGRVTLRGQVRSWYQKQMAQETLLRLEGIDLVENQLEVSRA